MYWIGIDIHLRMSSVCILDENGKPFKEYHAKTSWRGVVEALKELSEPFCVCFEASTGYGAIYEELAKIAVRVVVAHPGQLRLIFRSKRKNDRVDARKLAKLLYLDEVPDVYVPSLGAREWREMITFRATEVRNRTAVKNRLRALLRTHGIVPPNKLWSKAGLNWLQRLEWPASTARLKCHMLIEEIGFRDRKIKDVEEALLDFSRLHPGIALLKTIPGVGIRTAEAVAAWIDDPARFRTNKTIGSYFGLVPTQDSSAGKERMGHITRQGPGVVRGYLTEAAWQGVRRCPAIRAHFERIIKNDPQQRKKKALIATAHYLTRVMLAMLKSGKGWDPNFAAQQA
jgi:transposase